MNLFDFEGKGPRKYESCLICGKSLSDKRPDAMYCGSGCATVASRRRQRLRKLSYDLLDVLNGIDGLSLDIETRFLLDQIKQEICEHQ